MADMLATLFPSLPLDVCQAVLDAHEGSLPSAAAFVAAVTPAVVLAQFRIPLPHPHPHPLPHPPAPAPAAAAPSDSPSSLSSERDSGEDSAGSLSPSSPAVARALSAVDTPTPAAAAHSAIAMGQYVFTPLRYDDDDLPVTPPAPSNQPSLPPPPPQQAAPAAAAPASDQPSLLPGTLTGMRRSRDSMRHLITVLDNEATSPSRIQERRKKRKLLVVNDAGSSEQAASSKPARRDQAHATIETLHRVKQGEHIRTGAIDGFVSERLSLPIINLVNLRFSQLAYKAVVLYPGPESHTNSFKSRALIAAQAIGPTRGYWALFCASGELDYHWRNIVNAFAYHANAQWPVFLASSSVFCDPESHTIAVVAPVPAAASLAQTTSIGAALLSIAPSVDTAYYRACSRFSAADTARLVRNFAVEEEAHVIKSSLKLVSTPVPAANPAPPSSSSSGSATAVSAATAAAAAARPGSSSNTTSAALRQRLAFQSAIAASTTSSKSLSLYQIDRSNGKPWIAVPESEWKESPAGHDNTTEFTIVHDASS